MNKKKKIQKQLQSESQNVERDDKIEMQGIVEEVLPGTLFNIVCDGGHKILATLAGKLRQNHIRIILGDRVCVVVSPYDLSRGRIIFRR